MLMEVSMRCVNERIRAVGVAGFKDREVLGENEGPRSSVELKCVP